MTLAFSYTAMQGSITVTLQADTLTTRLTAGNYFLQKNFQLTQYVNHRKPKQEICIYDVLIQFCFFLLAT